MWASLPVNNSCFIPLHALERRDFLNASNQIERSYMLLHGCPLVTDQVNKLIISKTASFLDSAVTLLITILYD
jgi:hypothetical protein